MKTEAIKEVLAELRRLAYAGFYVGEADDEWKDTQSDAVAELTAIESLLEEPKECQWFNNPSFDGDDIWQTDCGHEFVFNEGTPSENGAKFCPYCGKKLVERHVEETK